MLNNLYAIHDMEAGLYFKVMLLNDDVSAKRTFRIMCKNEMREFKNAFRIVKIGVLDEKTGNILPCEPLEIVNGGEVQIDRKEE